MEMICEEPLPLAVKTGYFQGVNNDLPWLSADTWQASRKPVTCWALRPGFDRPAQGPWTASGFAENVGVGNWHSEVFDLHLRLWTHQSHRRLCLCS
jgi:hypothetical protein